ncbi:hypothetical protein [Salininema proteolyticum]|uniref:Uncharacterized protein n=1 Tax=Salininema proteolyticum TaxID=1607685 RepID=A0ABV8TWU6_9ACTN
MPTILRKLPLGDKTVAIVRRSTKRIVWIVIDFELAGIVHIDGWIRLCSGWSLHPDDLEHIRREALAAAAIDLLERNAAEELAARTRQRHHDPVTDHRAQEQQPRQWGGSA